jgi:glycosyltransferase involved in cell wall biosynthesis
MNKKMAVCISAYEPGGQSVVLEETTKRFSKTYDIDLYCIDANKTAPYWIKNVYLVRPWLHKYIPFISKDFIRTIRLRNYDIIHCHDSLPFLDAFQKSEIKYFVTCHGNTDWRYRDGIISKIDGILSLHFYRKPYQNAHRIIAISKYIKDWLRNTYGVESRLIYNGVNLNRFKRTEKISAETRYPICLYFGQLSKRKGVHDLLKAVKALKVDYPNVLLQLGGFGKNSFVKKLNKSIINNNISTNVRLLGFVSDEQQAKYYNNCDVVLTASYWEGFGLPIVESYSCGKPIFVRNCTAMMELVDNDRFRFDSVDELVKKIGNYLSSEIPNDAESQFSVIAKKFNWDYCANLYLKMFGN